MLEAVVAAASHEAAARPRNTTPARMGRDAPGGDETTASHYRKLPQTTANPEVARRFAVADSLIEDEELDDDLDLFRNVDANVWRIERRYRVNREGHNIMYYNYRRRKIMRVDGKQRVEYLKGGKRRVA